MKKIIWIMALLIVLIPATASAATTQTKLPNTWTYTKEWVNLHLFTYRASSKIIVLDRLATNRTNDILTGYELGKTNQINNLLTRYGNLEKEINAILAQKKLANYPELIAKLEAGLLAQQKTLSEVRQNTEDQNLKTNLATIQENTVNGIKNTISSINGEQSANNFTDKIVTIWRDPTNSIKDEKATRVYAAGTTATGNDGNNGIIIDQGQAKITKDNSNNLKIEYAPGTGPSSVTGDNGKHVWKIQNSDGTVIESYSSGKVVVGGTSGVAGNVVINTTGGGTSNVANVVKTSPSGGGTSTIKVMGGLPKVVGSPGTATNTVNGNNNDSSVDKVKSGTTGVKIAPQESGGTATDPSQTQTNSIKSANPINHIDDPDGQGDNVAPATPLPQQ